jgi:hypothetical protein
MADPLNTLGFVSWGLLGEGTAAEKVYVLDMEVEVAREDQEIGVEVEDLQSISMGLDDQGVSVVVSDEISIGVEMEDEAVTGETGDMDVETEVCE